MQSVNPRSQESYSHPTFFHWGWFLSLIILGQLILSFGADFVGDGHQIFGAFIAFTGSILLVQFAKPAIQNYWEHPIILSRRQINGSTSRYYTNANRLLGNQNGFKGRLEVLIHGNLWDKARTELTLWEKKTSLTPQEASWLTFLTAHGLELRIYSTYTASEPVIASFRQYVPEIHIGYTQAVARKRLHFAARAEGQLYVPKDGHYRFEDLTNIGNAQTIAVDGVTVVDTSTHGFDVAQANPIYLKCGLHSFSAENCSPFRMEGAGNKPAIPICIPNPLSCLYGFDAYWWLKWEYEHGPSELIPPECFYAPGAKETPLPMKL